MLPLTFKDPADYERVQPTDFVDLIGVEKLAPNSVITMVCKHKDGSKDEIELVHSFNEGQSELGLRWQCHNAVHMLITSSFLSRMVQARFSPQLDGQAEVNPRQTPQLASFGRNMLH